MSPAENLLFLLLAFGALLAICVSWLLLRTRKKWAWMVTGVVIVIYIDEAYANKTASVVWQGEEIVLSAAEHKGKIVILEK